MTKAILNYNTKRRITIQEDIVHSVEAKMLAIRKVSEIAKASPGIDGVEWIKASDKMRAAIFINTGEYKAKPLRQYIFHDVKARKR